MRVDGLKVNFSNIPDGKGIKQSGHRMKRLFRFKLKSWKIVDGFSTLVCASRPPGGLHTLGGYCLAIVRIATVWIITAWTIDKDNQTCKHLTRLWSMVLSRQQVLIEWDNPSWVTTQWIPEKNICLDNFQVGIRGYLVVMSISYTQV